MPPLFQNTHTRLGNHLLQLEHQRAPPVVVPCPTQDKTGAIYSAGWLVQYGSIFRGMAWRRRSLALVLEAPTTFFDSPLPVRYCTSHRLDTPASRRATGRQRQDQGRG